MTDEGGAFVFGGLVAGPHGLTATRSGYVEGAYERLRPNGDPMPLQLADGERKGDIKIKVWKFGAIAGTVTDETGDPLVGVGVRALRSTFVAGRRRLVSEAVTTTDDRGAYRFGGLVPGNYVVVVPSTETTLPADIAAEAASDTISSPVVVAIRDVRLFRSPTVTGKNVSTPTGMFVQQPTSLAFTTTGTAAQSNGRPAVYPTTYNGDTTIARQASSIAIGSGDVRSAVDVHVRPTPTWSVSGRLLGPNGGAVAVQVLRLFTAGPDDDLGAVSGLEAAIAITDRTGAFTFLGVPPGQYLLRANSFAEARPGASPPPPSAPNDTWWISEPVVVGNQDVTITPTWREAFGLSGRAVFDGMGAPPPDRLLRVPIVIESADQRQPQSSQVPSRFAADGTFNTPRMAAGRYLVRLGSSPPGWALKSVMYDGRDIADTGLDLKGPATDVIITFTNQITSLSGSVTTTPGLAATDATILLFPVDSTLWQDFGMNPRRLKSARVDATGRYQFGDVPAGDYFVIAIPEDQAVVWREPGRLTALSGLATRVHLDEGQKTTRDLRSVDAR